MCFAFAWQYCSNYIFPKLIDGRFRLFVWLILRPLSAFLFSPAKSLGSSTSQNKPVSPSLRKSGIPPTGVAIIGKPAPIASKTKCPALRFLTAGRKYPLPPNNHKLYPAQCGPKTGQCHQHLILPPDLFNFFLLGPPPIIWTLKLTSETIFFNSAAALIKTSIPFL